MTFFRKRFQLLTIALILITTSICTWDKNSISAIQLRYSKSVFEKLKKSVHNYLKNSWVSEEKAELIMDLIEQTHPQVCVDLGAYDGSSALPIGAILKYLNMGKVYLIDAWSNQEATKNISPQSLHYAWWASADMEKPKNQCLNMIHQWMLEPYCEIIHAPSQEAVHRLKAIDFLLLDGNFSEEGSLLDATLYLPKVNSGGYILLSNALITDDNKCSKASTIWHLYHECELVSELENGNVMLFRKQ